MPIDEDIKAKKVLEINADHSVMDALAKAYESGEETIGKYAKLLYEQARLIEGLPVEDPIEFSNSICELMTK